MKIRIVLLLVMTTALGCAGPRNPSFDVSAREASDAIDKMESDPRPLDRPIVVLDGFLMPGFGSSQLAEQIRDVSGDRRVISITFFDCTDFESCRERVIRRVDEAFPTDNPNETTEVDVVAISMGGLVARYAAMDVASETVTTASPPRRLKIARLFTFASPLQGANLANAIPGTVMPLHRDMKSDSNFLREIDTTPAGYEIIAYVRLGDAIVGAQHAAPPGQNPHWIANKPLESAHVLAFADDRLVADMLRRLRGETPFATSPASALPQ